MSKSGAGEGKERKDVHGQTEQVTRRDDQSRRLERSVVEVVEQALEEDWRPLGQMRTVGVGHSLSISRAEQNASSEGGIGRGRDRTNRVEDEMDSECDGRAAAAQDATSEQEREGRDQARSRGDEARASRKEARARLAQSSVDSTTGI